MLLIFSIGIGSLILVLLSSGINVLEKELSILIPTSFILMLNTGLIEEGWTNSKSEQQWRNTIKTYVTPYLDKKPFIDINVDDIHELLLPICSSKTDTARRLQQRLLRIFAFATIKKWYERDNPLIISKNNSFKFLNGSVATPKIIRKKCFTKTSGSGKTREDLNLVIDASISFFKLKLN